MQFAPEPAMSAWSCPHDLDGICQRVRGAICSPGMRGCELEGKVRFALDELNEPRKPVKARPAETRPEPKPSAAAAPRRRLPF
jgi:hypothetical protein